MSQVHTAKTAALATLSVKETIAKHDADWGKLVVHVSASPIDTTSIIVIPDQDRHA